MKEIMKKSTPLTVYDWVACVARIVPEATFSAGTRIRDNKHRVVVETPWMNLECVVEEDKAEAVRDHLYTKRPCIACEGKGYVGTARARCAHCNGADLESRNRESECGDEPEFAICSQCGLAIVLAAKESGRLVKHEDPCSRKPCLGMASTGSPK